MISIVFITSAYCRSILVAKASAYCHYTIYSCIFVCLCTHRDATCLVVCLFVCLFGHLFVCQKGVLLGLEDAGSLDLLLPQLEASVEAALRRGSASADVLANVEHLSNDIDT